MDKIKLGTIDKAYNIRKKGHALYEWCACELCGKERWVIIIKGKRQSNLCFKCAIVKFNQKRRGVNSPFWKGGSHFDNGYVSLYLERGHKFESMCNGSPGYRRYVAEHRLVMAEHLGRCLQSSEIVHHKDGNRSNNKIENLELTALGKHSKEHSKGYMEGFNQGYSDGINKATKENRL